MITQRKFKQLQAVQDQDCISIYIPTEVTGDYEKNRIRWKNAIQEAEKKCEDKGVDKKLLRPAKELTEDADFWAHQSKGFAGFYTEDFTFQTNLPTTPSPIVSVHSDFYLYPLIPIITNQDRVFILAVSRNQVKFYEAQHDGIYPVNIETFVVKNMDEALQHIEEKQSLQHHSTGFGNAAFHGNGPGQDLDAVRLQQYLRRIDDGLMEMIHDEKVPLVIAAVEEYHPVYKEITNYNHFSNHMIYGNPEDLTPTDLRTNVQPVFTDLKNQSVLDFLNSYNELQHKKMTSEGFEEISQAAEFKNIARLLIDKNYYSELDSSKRESLDNLVLKAYQDGAEIIISASSTQSTNPIKAINRFELELTN